MNKTDSIVGTETTRKAAHGVESQLPVHILPLPLGAWPQSGYSVWPYASAGTVVGAIAGCTSLLANIIGSVAWPTVSGQEQHVLRIVQVYLTFPLGESALYLNSGLLLALGCVLYIVTGALYGMLFEIVLSFLLPRASFLPRLTVCTILALAVWAFNFYAVLAWLQPLVLGGNWIMDLIPWWVAAATHLVFGWTIAVLDTLRSNQVVLAVK